MGLFLVWCHRLICIVLSLCKHACKKICDVKQGIDQYPLLARSWDRWWPDFVTFTASKRSICVSNRCKDLFNQKKIFWGYGHFKQLRQCLTTLQIPWRSGKNSAACHIFNSDSSQCLEMCSNSLMFDTIITSHCTLRYLDILRYNNEAFIEFA